MSKLDHKESWAPTNWCFWTVELQKTLESALDCKEIKSVNPQGNQSWIFIGRTNAEGEAPILWPHDSKNWLTGKDPDAKKDWRRRRGRQDEMVRWHHLLDGHEFDQAPEVGDEHGSLACCSPLVHKESDMTEWLNWTEQDMQLLTPKYPRKKLCELDNRAYTEKVVVFVWGSLAVPFNIFIVY